MQHRAVVFVLTVLITFELHAACSARILQLSYDPTSSILTYQIEAESTGCQLDRPEIYVNIGGGR